MRPAELCAPERAPGAGVANRTDYPQRVDELTPVGLYGGGGGGAALQLEGEVGVGAHSSAIRVVSVQEALHAAEPNEERGLVQQVRVLRSRVYVHVKVAAEWLVSLMLLVLTAPLIAGLAALIKLTSQGPAFYLQTRLGRNGKAYRICKLRTMVHNCEAATGPVWATPDDVRITPLGRVLRDTHLDEVPQLWNVLCGHMALIGPRPERPEIVARIERQLPDYRCRLEVRPGVTGLAQMRCPADTDLESVKRKLAHDLYYVQNLSLVMDLRIAACTALYFTAAAAQALCNSAVGCYGREVKLRLKAAQQAAERACAYHIS